MNDLDNLIRDTLHEEDAQWFAEWDEQSLTEAVIDSFQGSSKWLVILVYLAMTVFLGLMIVAAVKFFQAETTRAMIAWSCGFLSCLLTVTMLKVWYWMELNKKAITREIKRFELQLARVSNRVDSQTQ